MQAVSSRSNYYLPAVGTPHWWLFEERVMVKGARRIHHMQLESLSFRLLRL